MKFARATQNSDAVSIVRMPSWITMGRAETLEDVAFISGAALGQLHLVVGCADLPQALFRERLALRAAETCVALSGRPERSGELRDALHLLRPGDLPGPWGEIYFAWRRAVEWPVSVKALHRALPGLDPDRIAGWLDAGTGAPVRRATIVLELVLDALPGTELPGRCCQGNLT